MKYMKEFVIMMNLYLSHLLGDEVKDITITINGFAKSAAMTGLRLGYTASKKKLLKV